MDLYQYDLVEATPFIVRVVDHLLNCQEDNLRLPESFKKELKAWKASESGVQLGKCVTCDNVKVISFSMIKRIHEHLKRNPIDGKTPFLHELLQNSQIVFPRYQPPPRNPELVARLEKIQRSLDDAEYNKMITKSIANSEPVLLKDIKLDSTHRQIWMLVNFLFTVIGSFVFGYFAAYYIGLDTIKCVTLGLIMGFTVFFADLYFILKYL